MFVQGYIFRCLVALMFTFCIAFVWGQEEYNFRPKWKVGDVKTITYKTNEKEYKDDQLISDTTMYNEGSVKVVEERSDAYVLELIFKNQALLSVVSLYEKLGKKLNDYKDVRILFTINKETAEVNLLNWEESQTFMNESIALIYAVLEKKVPEFVFYARLILSPIEEVFNSKENVEAYIESEYSFLFIPFHHTFTNGETIEIKELGENPLNPMEEVEMTTRLTLKSIDKTTQTCKIKKEVVIDMSDFIDMMKSMMRKMAQAFEVNDSISEKKEKEIDDFDIAITNEQILSFNYATTWVTKVEGTGTVSGTDPKTGVHEKKIITTLIQIH